MTEFEKLSFEFVKFMRGKYRLDEVAGMYYEIPCIRFRQGKKTIVSVNMHKKKLASCHQCEVYPCEQATVGYRLLEHRSISADDVTWAILPYVPHQYEQ